MPNRSLMPAPFANTRPMLWDQPSQPRSYRMGSMGAPMHNGVQAPYGPVDFAADAFAKFVGQPLYNIATGKTMRDMAAPRDAVPMSDDPREAMAVAEMNRSNAAQALGAGMEAGGMAALGSVGTKAPAGALRSGPARPDAGLPSINASQDEINLLRSAYAQYDQIPDGWYVHGRNGSKELNQDWPTQATRSFDTMEQYGKSDGSGWAIAPMENAKVLDFRGIDTPDIRRATANMMRDARRGENNILDDVIDSYWDAKPKPREISENIRQQFAPDNIVSSAAAFDDPSWWSALLRAEQPDFIHTPDGAVSFFNPETTKAVRLFANPFTGAATPLFASPDRKRKASQ